MPPPKNAGPLKPVLNGLLRKDPNERINAEEAERLLRRAAGKRAGASRCSTAYAGRGRTVRVSRARRWCRRRARPRARPDQPRQPAAAGPYGAAAATADGRVPLPHPRADGPDREGDSVGPPTPTAKVGRRARDAGPERTTRPSTAPTPALDEPASTTEPVDPAPRKPANPASVDARAGRARLRPAAPVDRPVAVAAGRRSRDHNRRNVLIGVLVALLLVGLVVVVPMLTNGDAGTAAAARRPTRPSAPRLAPPQSSAPAAPRHERRAEPDALGQPVADPDALPAGWKLHKDPAGFALPLPANWVRRSAGADTVVFDEPNGVRRAAHPVDRPTGAGRVRRLEGAGAGPQEE